MNPVRVYIINGTFAQVNIPAFAQYLYDSADIIAYWNYIPLVYCVKSRLTATELAQKLMSFFYPAHFLIGEVNAQNLNGILPPDAWQWFYLEHHEKIRAPQPTPALQLGFLK